MILANVKKYKLQTTLKQIQMKKPFTIYIAILFLTLGLLSSCNKTENIPDEASSKDMKTLQISNDFNWSAGVKGTLNVQFYNPYNISTELEYIYIVNSNNQKLSAAQIINGEAVFNITLPANGDYYLYYPLTESKQKITETGDILMDLTKSNFKSSKELNGGGTCTTCEHPIVNGGGEEPVTGVNWIYLDENDVPGWTTTSPDHTIEIWTSGFMGIPAQEGNQFLELNATHVAALYQELCLIPGSTVLWSVWHRGRRGVDVAKVKIGATLATATEIATMTDGNQAWGHYSGSYTVPAGQTTTVFVFESISAEGGNQTIGNFLDNFEIQCDMDGDGIPDDDDSDPNDPNVAFISHFPTAGKQVVAFEDLWPSYGDFDFNDVIMSNQAIYYKNASMNLVKADFKVSLDALGSGFSNGVGMMIYDENGNAFNSQVISNVTGDATLDQGNTNGLILTEDAFDFTNYRYQNNGAGPKTDTPDTLRFTVEFNTGVSDVTPELYIFRTDERSHEVHRSIFPGTAVMNQSLFNTDDDTGNFRSATNLPWGMEIIMDGNLKPVVEKIPIIDAYPQFGAWATSNGVQNQTWYENPDNSKVVDIFSND